MPTYPVKNLKTGEEQELSMSVKDYEAFGEKRIPIGIRIGVKVVLPPKKLGTGRTN